MIVSSGNHSGKSLFRSALAQDRDGVSVCFLHFFFGGSSTVSSFGLLLSSRIAGAKIMLPGELLTVPAPSSSPECQGL